MQSSFSYPIFMRFGMQANLAGGPHMKATVSGDALGRCAAHIASEIKPWW